MKSLYSKYLLTFFAASFVFLSTHAQKLEFGLMGGGSMYYGDIVNDFDLNTMKGSCGAYVRRHINEHIAIKGFVGYCRVGGADSNSTSDFQQHRNLSFWSDIFEGSVQVEFNFVEDIIRGRRVRNRFIPYGFVGVGGFYFLSYATNPATGKPVKLKSLHTEGKSYDPYSICVPLGIGFRYKVSANISFGIECGLRYTATSYIDDIGGVKATYPSPSVLPSATSIIMYDRSKAPRNKDTGYGYGYPGKQRGKVAISDIYAMFGVTLGYRLEYVKAGILHGKPVTKLRF